MRYKRIWILIFILSVILQAGKLKTCYSIQIYASRNNFDLSSFNLSKYHQKCIQIKYPHLYALRCGCFKDYNRAEDLLKKIKKEYKDAYIQKTYLYRFKKDAIAHKKDKSTPVLTTCRLKRDPKKIKKRYPWENIDSKRIKKSIKTDIAIIAPPIKKVQTKTKKEKKEQEQKIEYYLRFYTDLYLKAYSGQTDINGFHLKGDREYLKFGLQYFRQLSKYWYFFTDDRVILHRKNINSNKNSGIDFEIKELYVNSDGLNSNNLNFLIGRKILKDDRSWYYNADLDSIGIFNKHDLLLYKLYFSTRLTKNYLFNSNTQNRHDLRDSKFIIGELSYQYFFKNYLKLYYLYEDTDPNDPQKTKRDLNWIGFRAIGLNHFEGYNITKYWFDISYVDGKIDENSISSNTNGVALEAGAKYKIDNSLAFALSFAYGSGGKNYYTQPYIANNKSSFLLKNSNFKYYGEFCDPELNNIYISSLYAIYEKSSEENFIVALHNYQKADSKYSFNGNYDYLFNTNNKNRSIGNEADLIYNFSKKYRYYHRFVLAYFLGGKAFDEVVKKRSGISVYYNFRYYW